jgi:hypothetical protein
MQHIKGYWSDGGHGPTSDAAVEMDLVQAKNQFSDGSGVKGNFFGLIDAQNNTVQFYFESDIPNDVEDARHLAIILLDFPRPELRGSFGTTVTIGQVHGIIDRVFELGADYRHFGQLKFSKW